MLNTLEQLKTDALGEIAQVDSIDALETWRVSYLGSKGRLKEMMPLLKNISKEDKPEVGKCLNDVKTSLESAFDDKKEALAGSQQSLPPYRRDRIGGECVQKEDDTLSVRPSMRFVMYLAKWDSQFPMDPKSKMNTTTSMH